ncbi:hypothetical protein KBA27_02630 [bacterium]|nr:hypothetical protein [bacterium]
MSFDVNSSSGMPIIREASAMKNDGGGGNLGYFEREEAEKRKKNSSQESIFEEKGEDTFIHEAEKAPEEEETFSISKTISKLIFYIKGFILSHIK